MSHKHKICEKHETFKIYKGSICIKLNRLPDKKYLQSKKGKFYTGERVNSTGKHAILNVDVSSIRTSKNMNQNWQN